MQIKKNRSAKIYKANKLLKMHGGIGGPHGSVLSFYSAPKNFQKNIDEAQQAVAKQKSKKKKSLSLIFFLINLVILAIVLTVQISGQEDMSITTLLNSTFSWKVLLLTIFIWVLIQVVDAYRSNILIKLSTGRSRPFLAYKTNTLGRYYDNLTPMATGGQPFQIYYMTSRGLNPATAISVPMGRFVFGQLCLSFIWTLFLIIGLFTDLGSSFNYIKPLCIIGWIINSMLMFVVLILTINQRVGKKVVVFVLKFLQKIKIIKNYEKRYNQVVKIVSDFQITIKNYAKSKKEFFKLLISSMLFLLMNYSIAFFVYCTMVGYVDWDMLGLVLLLSTLIEMASSFMPLPGGTGVMELTFTALFATVFANNAMLTWALLIWRFFSYYSYLLQGILLMGYDNIIGNKKYLWLKKKWELESESISFTQDKLHEYTLQKNKNKKKVI